MKESGPLNNKNKQQNGILLRRRKQNMQIICDYFSNTNESANASRRLHSFDETFISVI